MIEESPPVHYLTSSRCPASNKGGQHEVRLVELMNDRRTLMDFSHVRTTNR